MADIHLRVMDRRVAPRYREPRPSDLVVGLETHLYTLFRRILGVVGRHRLRRLSICCHGIEAGVADQRRMVSRVGGGFGLSLGWEDLTLATAGSFQALRGKFAPGGMIDLYACAAADDSSTTGFTGNGRLLMREIAGHANALVRASDAVQVFRTTTMERSFLGFPLQPAHLGIDCGAWEGNVWIFPPSGAAPRLDSAPGRGER
ncbi:hypothetical protein [Sediminicoccus sp. KRV36]|uniref:hypothetical protein n=1 Tax=Sediminicoccus sp. KRV36 TaxID=3133721 RepID=UPI002010392D|nr:hypothetical protein [Sediminicoccus rosea]UPY38288.1 hypothetical protein LHU95_06205 [Sediminicoccus rosea]